MKAPITSPGFRIIRTEGVVDERSRVIYAVAEVKDPYGVLGTQRQRALTMGTFVKASIEGIAANDLIVLPRHVLRQDNTVLVVDEDYKLQISPVQVVRATPNEVYIRDGLRAGQKVIATAIEVPIPGTELAIKGEPGKADEASEERLADTVDNP